MTKKVSKVTKRVDTVDTTEVDNQILDRLSKLEKRQKILVDGLRWAGTAIKPIFGIGGIGAYFCEIADKAEKA